MAKKRLDHLLVEQNLVESRSKAQALIMSGNVFVNEEKITKSGARFNEGVTLRVKEQFPYVSRGALKLEQALKDFSLDFKDLIVLDMGSSTGGFTDLVLQNGAKMVYAVDVGTNQLHYKLRSDERVCVMEQTNGRILELSHFEQIIDFAVCDVSFISLKLILPVFKRLNIKKAVVLIKPQFEVGKEIEGFDGVVKKEEHRELAINRVKSYAKESGYQVSGLSKSPIQGPKGNQEYLLYLLLNEM